MFCLRGCRATWLRLNQHLQVLAKWSTIKLWARPGWCSRTCLLSESLQSGRQTENVEIPSNNLTHHFQQEIHLFRQSVAKICYIFRGDVYNRILLHGRIGLLPLSHTLSTSVVDFVSLWPPPCPLLKLPCHPPLRCIICTFGIVFAIYCTSSYCMLLPFFSP